jgi:hypothetical protein
MARSSGKILAVAAAALTSSCASPSDPIETAGSAIAGARDDDAEARFRGMLLEAYANTLPAGFREDTSAPALCAAPSPNAKVFSWNAPLGQWFASALKAELKNRHVGPELWVVRVPLTSGSYDVVLLGRPLRRAATSSHDAGACGAFAEPVPLLTCRDVANDEPLPEESCSSERD